MTPAHHIASYRDAITTNRHHPRRTVPHRQEALTMTHPASSQPHDADWYEIRVQGRLDPRWSAYLDGAQLAPGSGGTTTVLTGRVVDQAALHGLLAGLRDLGLPL